ncbi:MAG: ribonuclease P protein component [Gammaproteobacteria bacterium]|nr:ribonuclease P protein component [Gammaproteobacteria bacterium]
MSLSTASCRFRKIHHLLSGDDFAPVFKQGKRYHSRELTLFCHPNGRSYPRLGLGISKKSLKRAVDRNRVKRQIREQFRLRLQQLGGVDLVITAKRGIVADRARIRGELDKLWGKVCP